MAAPVIVTAVGSGNTITITYDQPLFAGPLSLPDFTITVNNNPVVITNAVASGSTVVLTIQSSFAAGAAILVTYTGTDIAAAGTGQPTGGGGAGMTGTSIVTNFEGQNASPLSVISGNTGTACNSVSTFGNFFIDTKSPDSGGFCGRIDLLGQTTCNAVAVTDERVFLQKLAFTPADQFEEWYTFSLRLGSGFVSPNTVFFETMNGPKSPTFAIQGGTNVGGKGAGFYASLYAGTYDPNASPNVGFQSNYKLSPGGAYNLPDMIIHTPTTLELDPVWHQFITRLVWQSQETMDAVNNGLIQIWYKQRTDSTWNLVVDSTTWGETFPTMETSLTGSQFTYGLAWGHDRTAASNAESVWFDNISASTGDFDNAALIFPSIQPGTSAATFANQAIDTSTGAVGSPGTRTTLTGAGGPGIVIGPPPPAGPQFKVAWAGSNSLIIGFDTQLATKTIPASNFTVTVNGVANTVTSATAQNNRVILMLTNNVARGNTVLVSYSGTAITGGTGVAPAFTNKTVNAGTAGGSGTNTTLGDGTILRRGVNITTGVKPPLVIFLPDANQTAAQGESQTFWLEAADTYGLAVAIPPSTSSTFATSVTTGDTYIKNNVATWVSTTNADPSQVYLCGFGQGAIQTQFTGMSGNVALRGIMPVSGWQKNHSVDATWPASITSTSAIDFLMFAGRINDVTPPEGDSTWNGGSTTANQYNVLNGGASSTIPVNTLITTPFTENIWSNSAHFWVINA